MYKKKLFSAQWAALPLLFCSVTVLAGGSLTGSFGSHQQVVDNQAANLAPACDSGNPARGDCATPDIAPAPKQGVKAKAKVVQADTMAQARQLGNEADGFIDESSETGSISTGYTGGQTRIGVGIDTEFKGKADLSHVFAESEDSATIGQGYLGVNPKADKAKGEENLTGAGAKISHHWVSKDANGQVSHVNKVFGAYDQNEAKDKKVTVGYGQENEQMFWSGHASKGISDKREVGVLDDKAGTKVYEKAYDYGIGGRVGTYLPEQAMRVQGGVDYEWASKVADNEKKATQLTVTGGVEKFFPDSPHSINANIDVYKKSGGFVEGEQKTEVRGGVGYRYDIASEAGIWQPEQQYRRVRVEIPGEEIKQAPKTQRKLVKHTMELESDTFFKLDSAKLLPEAEERLLSVIAQIRASGHEGNIHIAGNTCDLGSDKHNKDLSERRARAVRDFLAKNGFNGNELLAEGFGEAQPKYPNTEDERHKNRRVDIEYVTYQNKYKEEVITQGGTTRSDPKVVWRKELIPTPPIWVRQALHNVAEHKQRIDTYKTTEGNQGGDNGGTDPDAPIANPDIDNNFTVKSCKAASIDLAVLANDEGTGIKINTPAAATNTTYGVVAPNAAKTALVYQPKEGAVGTDSFYYTIVDTNGVVSDKASVEVDVTACDTTPVNRNETDTAATVVNTKIYIGLWNSGRDRDGNALTLKTFDQTSTKGGSITAVNGKLQYTPKTDFVGVDTFKYDVTDSTGELIHVTVTVTVIGNTPITLVASNDEGTVEQGNKLSIDALNNDNPKTGVTLELVSAPQYGTVSIQDNHFVYTAAKDYTGDVSFTYVTVSGTNRSQPATVTVHITAPVNHAPIANDDPAATPQDTAVTIDVLANDSDPDQDSISLKSFQTASVKGGTIEKVNGKLVYTPAKGFYGTDTFTYIIVDAKGLEATATARITVNQGIDPGPVCVATQLEADEIRFTYSNDPPTLDPYDVLSNDTGTDLQLVGLGKEGVTRLITDAGTAQIIDGQIKFWPNAQSCAPTTFTYVVKDKCGNLTTGTVNIVVD
jgi:outer membrane protein OmpA-like peptidoglycan-associated protein